jgi:HlyD family secretion protein|tara:strand:- start:118641 stop:119873 length:1233 start_codon:yes stop_codon:yes gene_type:complete
VSRKLLNWKTLLLVLLVAVAGAIAWQKWQGPEVRAYRVAAQPLVQQVVATGRVASDSRAEIGSEITAVVKDRLVERGQTVQHNDILMVLRADELKAQEQEAQAALALLHESRRPQAQARLEQAQSHLTQTKREVQRRRLLAKEKAIPTEDLEQAENTLAAAQASFDQARLEVMALAQGGLEESILQQRLNAVLAALDKTQIRAPFSGTVLEHYVAPGDTVQPGQKLLTMRDQSNIELLVPVDERNLGILEVGQPAVIIADAFPNRPFNAEITSIAPVIDPQRGTVDIRLSAAPAPDFLKEDMTITATIETARSEEALVVPNDTLFQQNSNQAKVWLYTQGKARETEVTIGLDSLSLSQITQGLNAGDIVLGAAGELTNGERVRAKISALPKSRDTGSKTRSDGETPMKLN